MKKQWRLIKELWPTKNPKSKINNIEGCTEPAEMADKLNEYFVNVGQNLQDKIPPGRAFTKFSNDRETAFKLHEVNYESISKLLRAISLSKACGVDGLTA